MTGTRATDLPMGTLAREMPFIFERPHERDDYVDVSDTEKMLAKKTKFVGAGIERRVHRVISEPKLVVKFSTRRESPSQVAKELVIAKKLGRLVPKTWFDKKHGVIVQKYIMGTRADRYASAHGMGYGYAGAQGSTTDLRRDIEAKVERKGIVPSDLHGGNVMVSRRGTPYIIDIGYFQWARGHPTKKEARLIKKFERVVARAQYRRQPLNMELLRRLQR